MHNIPYIDILYNTEHMFTSILTYTLWFVYTKIKKSNEILAKENAKYDQAMKIGNAIRKGADPETVFQTGGQNIPKCPTCGSSNIKKISTASKIAGATMFGLFSRTAKSQFKCGNCGYTW